MFYAPLFYPHLKGVQGRKHWIIGAVYAKDKWSYPLDFHLENLPNMTND